MTIHEIKRRTQETEPHFFTHSTMKFFHQTLRDFSVTKGGNKYRISAPMKDNEGRVVGRTERLFNPETNELETVK